jgi:hypothetical protein
MWGEPMRFPGGILALIVAAALLLAACTGDAPRSVENAQFAGVPLPRGYSLDADRSMAIGSDRWIGRLVFTTGMSSAETSDFFRSEMPRYGWGEGAVTPSDRSILTFFSTQTGRVAVVQIAGRSLWRGSRVEMVISSPSGAGDGSGAAPPSGGSTAEPAIMPAPVTVQPLQ